MLGCEARGNNDGGRPQDDLRAAQACGLATALCAPAEGKRPKVKVDVAPEPSFDFNRAGLHRPGAASRKLTVKPATT